MIVINITITNIALSWYSVNKTSLIFNSVITIHKKLFVDKSSNFPFIFFTKPNLMGYNLFKLNHFKKHPRKIHEHPSVNKGLPEPSRSTLNSSHT